MSILESSGDLQQIPETRPHPKQSANETGNQSFWSSTGLGTTDIKYRNQTDLSILPFEIYPGHHSRELTKGRKEGRKGGRNKGTNTKAMHYFFFVFLKKIICTYTPCCSWRWLYKALKKSLSGTWHIMLTWVYTAQPHPCKKDGELGDSRRERVLLQTQSEPMQIPRWLPRLPSDKLAAIRKRCLKNVNLLGLAYLSFFLIRDIKTLY